MCLSCQSALRALNYYVPTCLRTYVPIYIFHAYVPSCYKLFCSYVRLIFTCLMPKTAHKIYELLTIYNNGLFLVF